jgi:transcriptional regulator with XRE-family HTH domain
MFTKPEKFAGSKARREELANFVKSRRNGLRPEAFGLTSSKHRRAEGLRREEVADLLGVSLSWYTKLEQGLDIAFSRNLLAKLADALRLTPIERSQLFQLGFAMTDELVPTDPSEVLLATQIVIDGLPYSPAFILNPFADFIGTNAAARAFFGNFDSFSGNRRNQLRSLFLEDITKKVLPDWEESARQQVAMFRSAYARNGQDPRFQELVSQLSAESTEFRTIWQRYELPVRSSRMVDYALPGNSILRFNHFTFFADLDCQFRVEVFTPLEELDSRNRMIAMVAAQA